MQCPTCKMAHLQDPENGQRWHVECPECGTILFLYVPMEHQDAFHRDTHKIKMYAGGRKSHSPLKTSQTQRKSKGFA